MLDELQGPGGGLLLKNPTPVGRGVCHHRSDGSLVEVGLQVQRHTPISEEGIELPISSTSSSECSEDALST